MSCPACACTRPPKRHLRAQDAWLVRCRSCGLVRVDPWPTREQALALYQPSYFHDAEHGYVDYVADEAVFASEMRRRLRTLAAAGAGGRLLDVGCATGVLLRQARPFGFDPAGLEPSAEMAKHASERAQCPVRAGPLDRAVLATCSYETITLFDVLEHLVDPREGLVALRRALRPGGHLGVTVPDFGGWWARASGRHWPMITPWEHLSYFTRRTLRRLLLAAGFTEVRFHAARTPTSWGTLATRLGLGAGRVPSGARHRGVGLPFGTLFAVAQVR